MAISKYTIVYFVFGARKTDATGTIKAAVRAASEEYLNVKAIINQTAKTTTATGQQVTIKNPKLDATPLPPLNLSHIGKLCPRTPHAPAIKEALTLTASELLTSIPAIVAAIPALKTSQRTVISANVLFPVRKTFVAPIFPEPIFLISPYPVTLVKISPKGIEPTRYPNNAHKT